MELVNEFTVPATPADAWALLKDVERIAPCLPGATVESQGGDSYTGAVSVKVGPIKVGYEGTVAFRELDRTALRMVLDARPQRSHRRQVDIVDLHHRMRITHRHRADLDFGARDGERIDVRLARRLRTIERLCAARDCRRRS